MVAIHWVAVEPATGAVIEELPGLRVTSSVPTMIGQSAGNVSVELPLTDRLPARWELATEPFRTVIVAAFDDPDQTVLWAGTVINRRAGSGSTIRLTMVDVPGWLGRRYVPDGTFTGTEQTAIMRWLGLDLLASRFHGQVDEIVTGVTLDRTYADTADKTRLDAMKDLMRVIDGPEWAVFWRWEASRLVCVPTVAQRLGRRSIDGQPAVVFDRLDWDCSEDWTDGKGATIVTGVATREGDQRVQVTRSADDLIAAGYLEVEHRWTPDTGSTSETVIASYVDAKLAAIRRGTRTYDVAVVLADTDLVLGRDAGLGDDVAFDLSNPDRPELGGSLLGRLIGWVAEPDRVSGQIVKVTPVLYSEE